MAEALGADGLTALDTPVEVPGQEGDGQPVEELDDFEAAHFELDEPLETVQVGEGIGYDIVIHDVTHVLVTAQDTEADALTQGMGGPDRFNAAHVVASNEDGDIGPTVIEVAGPEAFEDEDGEELEAVTADDAFEQFVEEYL